MDMSNSDERALSRHPLFVLFIGAVVSTVLSAVLVPIYQSRSLRISQKAEAKQNFERELYQYDGKVNTCINSLITAFEFSAKNGNQKPTEEMLVELRRDAIFKYGEFNEVAWWKLDSLILEVTAAIEIDDAAHKQIWEYCANYEKVLEKRTANFSPAWPFVYSLSLEDGGKNSDWLSSEVRPTQAALAGEGQQIIGEMIKIIRKGK